MNSKINKTLLTLGFKLLDTERSKNANGVDLYVMKNKRVYSVEIKKARKLRNGSNGFQCPPVEKNRQKDDLIAIEMPSGYVLVQSMREHIKVCSKKGYRCLTPLS